MTPVSRNELQSSAVYPVISAGATTAAALAAYAQGAPTRGIFYKGACTVVSISDASVVLIPVTDYTFLAIQIKSVTSSAEDYQLFF